jgi:hypothetical protein
MDITPDIAKQFLALSAGNPRYNNEGKVNKTVVEKYASDMKRGVWELTSQGISFNESGKLIDGHHRLNAIISSGCTIKMYVTHNVPNDSVYFDRAYTRTTQQILKFSFGVDDELSSSIVTSVARLHRYFEMGLSCRARAEKITDYEIYDFIENHKELLRGTYSCINFKSNGQRVIRNAGFAHAIFCALSCGVDQKILLDFSEIANSGFCNDEQKYAAILARNMLLEPVRGGQSMEARVQKSAYVQMCIRDFVGGVKRTRRYAKTEAVYTNQMLKKKRGETT